MPASNLSCHVRTAIGAAMVLVIAMHCAPSVAAPQVVATIALPDPVRWDYVTVDPTAHRLYVAHRERVDVIDTRDGKSILQLAPTPGVHGAAGAPDLNRVFTSNSADGTVGVFDATSGKLLQTVKAGKNPDAIVYEPATHRVFAFNGDSADVTAIDARSLKVLAASIPVSGTPEFAVVDGRGRVYFNIEDKSELAVLDAQTLHGVWCGKAKPTRGHPPDVPGAGGEGCECPLIRKLCGARRSAGDAPMESRFGA